MNAHAIHFTDSRARELFLLCAAVLAFTWYFLQSRPVPESALPAASPAAVMEAAPTATHDAHQVVTGELRCAKCRRLMVGADVHTDLLIDGSPASLLCNGCAHRMSEQQRQQLYDEHGLRRSLGSVSHGSVGPPPSPNPPLRLASWRGLATLEPLAVSAAPRCACGTQCPCAAVVNHTPAAKASDNDDPPRRRRPILRAMGAVGRFVWRPFRRWRGC